MKIAFTIIMLSMLAFSIYLYRKCIRNEKKLFDTNYHITLYFMRKCEVNDHNRDLILENLARLSSMEQSDTLMIDQAFREFQERFQL